MKILFVHHRLPWPATSGMDKLRFNLIKCLSQRHQVTVICPVNDDTKPEHVAHVERICSELIVVPRSRLEQRFRKTRLFQIAKACALILGRIPMHASHDWHLSAYLLVKKLLRVRSFDCLQVSSNICAPYLNAAPPSIFRILGPMDDAIEGVRLELVRSRTKYQKCVGSLMLRAVRHYDGYWAKICERVFFHSEEDRDRFATVVGTLPNARVLRVPNELSDEMPDSDEREINTMIFVGGFGASFNHDAALYLVFDILPLVRMAVPNVRLYLVGQSAHKIQAHVDGIPGVIVAGNVENIDQYVSKATVFANAVRAGTGVKTKVIEALRIGIPIVSTPAGIQGLWKLDNEAVVVRNTPEEFAEAIVHFLMNPERAKSAARRARMLYERHYSCETVANHTLAEYDAIEQIIANRSLAKSNYSG